MLYPAPASRVALDPVQTEVGPVIVGVGLAFNVITTSFVLAVQGALEIVQRNVYVVPATPVNVEVGLVGVDTEPPAPDIMLQAPIPITGVLPARVTEVLQTDWSGPAFDVVGFEAIT